MPQGNKTNPIKEAGTFDFVVVGAGTAGCILAARLADEGHNSVVVVEAGRQGDDFLYDLPMLAGRLFQRPANNWFYGTTPQPQLGGRSVFMPRGKKVGGSFIFNGCIYVRGNKYDYDHWAQLGNAGWSYAEVLPYFMRTETYITNGVSGDTNGYHGRSGPLRIGKPRKINPLTEAFLAACKEVGFPLNDDFNGPVQEGFGINDFTASEGRRNTTRKAFLDPAIKRGHVTLMPNIEITKILIEHGRAVGVSFERGRAANIVRARKEVILSAGAINSPKLLMLSGIGDAADLRELGIEVVNDLPGVGRNLMDHLNVGVAHRSKKKVTLGRTLRIDRFAAAALNAVFLGGGPIGRSPLEGGGYFFSRPGLEAPDLNACFVPIFGLDAKLKAPWAESIADHSYGMSVWRNRTSSRGIVRLHSRDHRVAPLIDPRYMTARDDLEATREAVKIGRHIMSAHAFAPYRGIELSPGRDVVTDDEIDAFILANGKTGHHPCGTAKMGSDKMAVVDSELKVHGIRGLRVVDASVLPVDVTAAINAAVMMIAERGSDFILGRRLEPALVF